MSPGRHYDINRILKAAVSNFFFENNENRLVLKKTVGWFFFTKKVKSFEKNCFVTRNGSAENIKNLSLRISHEYRGHLRGNFNFIQ